MDYTINRDEKIAAVEEALGAIEEDVLIACLGRGVDADSIAEDFASDDPSDADLVLALSRLSAAKAYLASL
jgi:hypothetical protein